MQDAQVGLIISAINQVNQNVTDIREDMRLLRSDMNEKIEEVKKQVKEHEEKDETYWKQINDRQAQLTLIKGLTFSSFGLWVITWFGEQIGIKIKP